jgi:hypothetical protein
MVGRNLRFQIAITIVEILEKKYPNSLTYKELEKEVNLCYAGQEPSSATLTNYLNMLSGRKTQYIKFVYKGVLYRRIEENLTTHYSLTKEFKDSLERQKLERQKEESLTNYIEGALSLHQFTLEADGEKAIEIIKPSKNEESPEDKRYST